MKLSDAKVLLDAELDNHAHAGKYIKGDTPDKLLADAKRIEAWYRHCGLSRIGLGKDERTSRLFVIGWGHPLDCERAINGPGPVEGGELVYAIDPGIDVGKQDGPFVPGEPI